jgi:hypothetical protein
MHVVYTFLRRMAFSLLDHKEVRGLCVDDSKLMTSKASEYCELLFKSLTELWTYFRSSVGFADCVPVNTVCMRSWLFVLWGSQNME